MDSLLGMDPVSNPCTMTFYPYSPGMLGPMESVLLTENPIAYNSVKKKTNNCRLHF